MANVFRKVLQVRLPGQRVLRGTGAPAASLGRVGDQYIREDGWLLYGPKTVSGWGAGVPMATGNPPPPPPPPPPPVPGFTRQPAITTDGSPAIGEIVALDFGEISGDQIGVRRIIDAGGATVATVTTGSYQLTTAGTFRLRVFAANTAGLYADSGPISVGAAVSGTMSAPRLAFEDGRVPGTNPPRLLVESLDASIDKNSDSLVVEFDRQPSGLFTMSSSLTVPLSSVQTVDDILQRAELAGLAAGDFRAQAYFTRPPLNGEPARQSGRSAVIHDVLAAPGGPAAPARPQRRPCSTKAIRARALFCRRGSAKRRAISMTAPSSR